MVSAIFAVSLNILTENGRLVFSSLMLLKGTAVFEQGVRLGVERLLVEPSLRANKYG